MYKIELTNKGLALIFLGFQGYQEGDSIAIGSTFTNSLNELFNSTLNICQL